MASRSTRPGNYGRSYHAGKQPALNANYTTADTAKGLGFQEQWDRAIEMKPAFVFVTQWNEWIAQRFVKCGTYDTGATQFMGRPLGCGDTHFIDDFNQEFSRDVEPMRGGHEDAYYYQLVANVRRYKGARAVASASPAKHMIALSGAAFADVGPDYWDDVGDVTHRSALGYAGPEKYENASGRNDFELSRVARDEASLFFYAKAHSALSASTGERWLTLWLDTDADAATGCAGFDYAVNRSRSGHLASVERCAGPGFTWERVGDAELATATDELVLQVPRAAVKLPASAGALSFRFKWTDNVPEPLAPLDLLQLGDSAPNGRFTYRYSASVDVEPVQNLGGAGGAPSSAGSAAGGAGHGGLATAAGSGGASSGGSFAAGGVSVSAAGTTAATPEPGGAGDGASCGCRVSGFAPRNRSGVGVRGLALSVLLLIGRLRRRPAARLC